MYKEDLSVYYKRECSSFDVFVGFFKISGFRAMCLYRIGNKLFNKKHYILAALVTRLIRFTCNMDIELKAKIGRKIRIPHPLAIVIGGNAVIGDGCTIMQCVTIGGNFGKSRNGQTQPHIGENVFLGAGAKILGPVTIGNDAKVGANSVVLSDIPAGELAVGLPAKVKQRDR